MEASSLFDIWRIYLVRFHGIDREQWHPKITHFSEQPKQRSLIDQRSCQQRIAVFFQSDSQTSKPVCPLRIKVPFDANLVMSELMIIFGCWVDFTHSAPFALSSYP